MGVLAGGGNPRIMPVGGYEARVKQKSKLSTLSLAELWDSPWHCSLLQLCRQMCTPPPPQKKSLKQALWKAKSIYLPGRGVSTTEAWSLTQRPQGNRSGRQDGVVWAESRMWWFPWCFLTAAVPWLGIGITAEKRNGHPSDGCPHRMGVLCFPTKPKSQGTNG